VGTELGDAGAGQVGGSWQSLAEVFPITANRNGGYGPPPDVPPGPHTLRITLVATAADGYRKADRRHRSPPRAMP
jgi:hypothetical protein